MPRRVELPETPREDDGEGDFVELDAGPVGGAVDPEVLGEAAVGALGAGEVDEGAESGVGAAAGEKGGRGLDHVAGPDEVVAAEVGVALGGSPGDGGGGDEGSGVGLVLVGEEDVVADAHEAAAVGGGGGETLGRGGATPLDEEAVAVKRRRGWRGSASCAAMAAWWPSPKAMAMVNSRWRAMSISPMTAMLPSSAWPNCQVIFMSLAEVLKAVAGADVAAGGAGEAAVGSEGERGVALPGEEAALAGDVDGAGGVAGAAAVEVRGEQSVALEAGEEGLVAGDLDVHQDDGVVGVGDELFGDGVAAIEVGGGDADGEGVGVDVVEVVLEVALLFVEEGFAVGEEELHVAGLGAIDGGVVDLVEGAVGDGEPDAAGGGVGGGDGVLSAGGPARFEAGSTKGRAVVVEPAVEGAGSLIGFLLERKNGHRGNEGGVNRR